MNKEEFIDEHWLSYVKWCAIMPDTPSELVFWLEVNKPTEDNFWLWVKKSKLIK